jgi:hypothetical protein
MNIKNIIKHDIKMGLPYSREYTKILENEATDRLHRKATPLKKTVPGRG